MTISSSSANSDRRAAVIVKVMPFYSIIWILMLEIQILGIAGAIFDRFADFLIDRTSESKKRGANQKIRNIG